MAVPGMDAPMAVPGGRNPCRRAVCVRDGICSPSTTTGSEGTEAKAIPRLS